MQKHALFTALAALYEKMDQAWTETADRYGFQCNGCTENCCETRFYHHTHLERAFFISGFKKLPPVRKKKSKKRALQVLEQTRAAGEKDRPLRIMCPVNEDQKCLLYRFRPMICRLHGIPHELHKPGSPPVKGPGCHAGAVLFETAYHPFDRTPFYREMADLEIRYCRTHGKIGRIRQTVAEMIAG